MFAVLRVNFHICRYDDGSEVPLCRPFECHILLPGNKKVLDYVFRSFSLTDFKVYPIEYSQCCIAAGGESGNG